MVLQEYSFHANGFGMIQERSPFSNLFTGFQVALLLILGYVYFQNNILGVLYNFHGNDFAHNYVAGYLLRVGGNPYDQSQLMSTAASLGIERLNPYVYPLFVAELFIPLTWFSYPTAKFIWFVFNHLFLLATICIYISTLPKVLRRMAGILFFGLSVSFFPLVRTLTAGQLNLLVLLLIVLIWKYAVLKKPSLAGCFIGLATMVKVFPAYFIFYYLVKKEYRIVVSALVTMGVLSLFTILCFGMGLFFDYISILKSMMYGQSVWSDVSQTFHVDPFNQSIHALIAHVLTNNPITQAWWIAPGIAKLLSVIVSLILVSLGFLTIRKLDKRSFDQTQEGLVFNFCFLCALLIPSLFWDHYLVYALFPLMALILYWIAHKRFSVVKIILLILIIYVPMAIPFNFRMEEYRTGMNIFWMSFKLYPLMVLWFWLFFNSLMQNNNDYENA